MNIFQALSILNQDIWLVHESYLTGVYPMVLDYLSKASTEKTPRKILEPECYYIVGDNATGFTAASKIKAEKQTTNIETDILNIPVLPVKIYATSNEQNIVVNQIPLPKLTTTAAANKIIIGRAIYKLMVLVKNLAIK